VEVAVLVALESARGLFKQNRKPSRTADEKHASDKDHCGNHNCCINCQYFRVGNTANGLLLAFRIVHAGPPRMTKDDFGDRTGVLDACHRVPKLIHRFVDSRQLILIGYGEVPTALKMACSLDGRN
jgi:hypothetical protein